MKKTHLLAPLSVTALLLVTTSASAQSARFSTVDRNGDGVLSYGELAETFGRAGADRLWSRGGGRDLSRSDIRRFNQSRDDDDEDGFDDDDDDGRFDDDDDDDDDGRRGGIGGDDDDDDGRGGGFGGRDDDDDDGGRGGGGDDDDD